MKVKKDYIVKLIQESLYEAIELPDRASVIASQDDIARQAYERLQSGEKINDIFSGLSKDDLNFQLQNLHKYIKENEITTVFSYDFLISNLALEISKLYKTFMEYINRGDYLRVSLLEYIKLFKTGKINPKVRGNIKNRAYRKPEWEKGKEYRNIGPDGLQNDLNRPGKKYYLGFLPKIFKDFIVDIKKGVVISRQQYKDFVKLYESPRGSHNAYLSLVTAYSQYFDSKMNDIISKAPQLSNDEDYIVDEYFGYFLIKKVFLKPPVLQGAKFYNILNDIKEKHKQTVDIEQKKKKTKKDLSTLKSLSTTDIGYYDEWFAIHYVGAFAKDTTRNYFESQTSFIESFGGASGITTNEFAAVPYPKDTTKLTDSIAIGARGNPSHPKIGMILKGKITGIYSDDVHSDTYRSAKQGFGFGGYNEEGEDFVRFPGMALSTEYDKNVKFFKEKDSIVYDLEKAKKEILNNDTYPGVRGYYECFVDDWYVDGIIANWKRFMDEFPLKDKSKTTPKHIKEFFEKVQEKNLKIYNHNFKPLNRKKLYNLLIRMYKK